MNKVGGVNIAMEDRAAEKEKQAVELAILKNQLVGGKTPENPGEEPTPAEDDKVPKEGGSEGNADRNQE